MNMMRSFSSIENDIRSMDSAANLIKVRVVLDQIRWIKEVIQSELNKMIIVCPHCKEEEVIEIYRPEVYEFTFFCRSCDKGFNL